MDLNDFVSFSDYRTLKLVTPYHTGGSISYIWEHGSGRPLILNIANSLLLILEHLNILQSICYRSSWK